MLLAVILRGGVRADNGHGHVNRGDGHVAVRHGEGHGAEVRVGVRELLGGQSHVGRACVGSRGLGRAREGEAVVHIVQGAAGRGRVAARAVLGAVVCRGGVRTGNAHGHVNRIDGHVAVRHGEGHVEVLVGVRELLC